MLKYIKKEHAFIKKIELNLKKESLKRVSGKNNYFMLNKGWEWKDDQKLLKCDDPKIELFILPEKSNLMAYLMIRIERNLLQSQGLS